MYVRTGRHSEVDVHTYVHAMLAYSIPGTYLAVFYQLDT